MGLKVYDNINAGGKTKVFSGSIAYVGKDWNDRISGLEVTDPNELWMVFTDSNYKGTAYGPFTYGGRYECGTWFKNDAISSLKVSTKKATEGLGEASERVTSDYEGKGQNVVTPSEISKGVESPPGASTDQGLPGQWDDKIYGAGSDVVDAGKDAVDQALDVASDVAQKVDEIQKKANPMFGWWYRMTPGQRTALVIGGLLVVGVGGFLFWKWYQKASSKENVDRTLAIMNAFSAQDIARQKVMIQPVNTLAGNPGFGQAIGTGAMGAML